MDHVKPSAKKYSFKKQERLKSRKLIRELFEKGSSFFIFPFKVIYLTGYLKDDSPHQTLVSIPRRNFRRAVDRNKLKRRVREAYRLNKNILYKTDEVCPPLIIAFIFVGKELMDFYKLESKLKICLERLKKEIVHS